MHAISFELNYEFLDEKHKIALPTAVKEIERILGYEGFEMKHLNYFIIKENDSIANLNNAINRLHNLVWFSDSLRTAWASTLITSSFLA